VYLLACVQSENSITVLNREAIIDKMMATEKEWSNLWPKIILTIIIITIIIIRLCI